MTLTRAYPARSSSGGTGGISETQHESLDSLTHKLAEDYFQEFSFLEGNLVLVTTWRTTSRLLRVRETSLEYVEDLLTRTVTTQFNVSGIAIYSLTKDFSYTASGEIESITTDRT